MAIPLAMQMPVSVAARRLQTSYWEVRAMATRGEIRGGTDVWGRYIVHAADVERLEAAQKGQKVQSSRATVRKT
jgi:hypothetical protein